MYIFQLYSILGFMFPEDSSPAFALFKFVQVVNFMKNRFGVKINYPTDMSIKKKLTKNNLFYQFLLLNLETVNLLKQ